MSPQQFSLRWNNHTKNLVQVFADQFERQQHVDVTISCQGRFLKAHKIVLGACSPYFQELFDSHESAPHPIIIMNGYSFEDIRSIVEFMYRGEVMVAETAMQRLLAAAEDLQIKGLSNVRSKRDSQQQQQQQGGDDEEMGEDAEEDQDDRDPQDLVAGSLSPQQQINGNGGAQFGSQSQLPLVPLPAENAAGGRVVKRRKRTRAVSYDNNEMKRKLRIQSNKSSSNNSQNNQTSGNADHHQQSSGTSPTSQGDDVQGGDGDGGGGQCGDAKDSELMMTINIEPPSVLMNDDDSSSVLTTSKDQEGQGNGEGGSGVTNNISTSSSSSSNNNSNNNNSSSGKASAATGQQQIMIPDMEPKEKIPRPPNSFMIFANEWRRQLAGQFPNESNKEISVRLGVMWKNLAEEVKAKYFTAARRANDDHKKKYPDYHYNPKEARMRKMWKLQQQSLGHLVTTASHH